MSQASEELLIIITGPVGAGKSTTATALAEALRRPGVEVAVIDLDLMYGFVRQREGYGEPAGWARARIGAAALANALFDAGMPVVIVEGEFFDAEELDTLTARVHAAAARRFFTLRIAYETALSHVQGDPSRGASKDPAFLRSLHQHFVGSLPFLQAASAVIDADALTQAEVVARLVAALGAGGGHPLDARRAGQE